MPIDRHPDHRPKRRMIKLKIDKAIKVLEGILTHAKPPNENERPELKDAKLMTIDAMKLGIEALKRFEGWREIDNYPGFETLPGETE